MKSRTNPLMLVVTLIVSLGVAITAFAQDDNYEENDTRETAYDLSSFEMTYLSSIDGLGIQSDDDWYRIQVGKGVLRVQIFVWFTHTEGDIDLFLYDDAGTLLTSSETTTNNETIDFIVASQGTYFFRVGYGNAGNQYDLWWDDAPHDEDFADDCSDAYPMYWNWYVSGNLETADDVDMFRFDLPVIADVSFWTEYTVDNVDTYGHLYDSSCQQIEYNDDSGDGLNFFIDRRLMPGTYYVGVHSFGYYFTGTYELWTSAQQVVDKIGVYRPSTRQFIVDADGNGYWNSSGDRVTTMGSPGDQPLSGDWNGDLKDYIGLFRPADSKFILDADGSWSWTSYSDVVEKMGSPGDLPITGDWNGDGDDDIGVFRPSTRQFILDYDESGGWSGPGNDRIYVLGSPGDLPIIGDWNGDGDDNIGVYRPTQRKFILDFDESGNWTSGQDLVYVYGGVGDEPIVGDWNGDGADEIGVYRPYKKFFILDLDASGSWTRWDRVWTYGTTGDIPVIGKW